MSPPSVHAPRPLAGRAPSIVWVALLLLSLPAVARASAESPDAPVVARASSDSPEAPAFANTSAESPQDPAGTPAPNPTAIDVEGLRLAGGRAVGRGFGMFGASLGVGIGAGLPLGMGFLADHLGSASFGSYLALGLGPTVVGLAVGNWIQAVTILGIQHNPGRHPKAALMSRASRAYWRTSSLLFGGAVSGGISLVLLAPVLRAAIAHPPPPLLGDFFVAGFATSMGISAAFMAIGYLEGERLLHAGKAEPVAWVVTPWFDPIAGSGGASAVVVF